MCKFDNVPDFSDGYTFSMLYSTYSRYRCNLKSFCCNLFREPSFFAIKCLYYTTAERVQRLHALGPFGDQCPSDIIRMIERILGRAVQGDEIATEKFLTRLPGRIQLIVLAQADIFTVEQMAKMADRLVSVPVTHGTFSVSQSHQPRHEVEPLTMSTLHHHMALLTSSNERMIAEVGQLKKTYRGPQGGARMNAASSERNRLKMFRGLNDEGVCWYNAAWGYNACKCVNGCGQAGNGHAGR